MILSIGGAVGNYGFSSDADAANVAQYIWDAFLGGSSATVTRPLGATPLDGVDLDIEGGAAAGYAAFVNSMRTIMDRSGKKYFITGAPQCPKPDYYLGPSPGTALGDAAAGFDYLFVQFYNNYCGYSAGSTGALLTVCTA